MSPAEGTKLSLLWHSIRVFWELLWWPLHGQSLTQALTGPISQMRRLRLREGCDMSKATWLDMVGLR